MEIFRIKSNFIKIILMVFLTSSLQGCFFFDFFKKDKSSGSDQGASDPSVVLGQSLGDRAGGIDEEALEAVYAITTTQAPAAIRPDPDLYARRLLLQYRSEGSTVARQIGSVEDYRELLGGASQDFQKVPQEEYDATSLLATLQVTEVICEGLVAPNSSEHPGWETILPADASDWVTNIRYLAQRFLGKPSDEIDGTIIDNLKAIMDDYNGSSSYSLASYVPVCATLSLDAEAAFL